MKNIFSVESIKNIEKKTDYKVIQRKLNAEGRKKEEEEYKDMEFI